MVRFRSIDNIIEEIQTLIKKYNVRHFDFQDELFTLNDKRVIEFCDRILKEKIKISWRCLGRANLAKLDVLKKMKKAGCHWIGYGIESGSPKMLEVMDKKINIKQAKKAIELTRQAGITPSATFIVGMPGETKETIKETVKFCKEAQIFNTLFFVVPYPGTFLYSELKNKNQIDDEEKFVLKMGQDATNLLFNLTDLPDEKLITYKKEAEEEIKNFLRPKTTNAARKKPFKRTRLIAKELIEAYKYWGMTGLLEIIKKKINKKLNLSKC
jgi:radical SAM superfamily enzyme YgiQ (UPF0313 family)